MILISSTIKPFVCRGQEKWKSCVHRVDICNKKGLTCVVSHTWSHMRGLTGVAHHKSAPATEPHVISSLVFDRLWKSCSRSAALPDTNTKDKRCRFDGHVSVCTLVSRQTSTRIDRTGGDPRAGRDLRARSSGLQAAGYPESRHFLSLQRVSVCVCVTFVRAGIPSWLRPRR